LKITTVGAAFDLQRCDGTTGIACTNWRSAKESETVLVAGGWLLVTSSN